MTTPTVQHAARLRAVLVTLGFELRTCPAPDRDGKAAALRAALKTCLDDGQRELLRDALTDSGTPARASSDGGRAFLGIDRPRVSADAR